MQNLQLNRVLGVLKTSTVLFCAAFNTQAVADDDSRQIEEVIVTAQRASESIQDVPIAVTALSGDMLEDRQILGATDLQMNAPNVSFTATNFGGSSFSIRGIGRLVIAASGENGVSTHVNDIPLGTNLTAVEFFDVARVEVLRGPQGTLYGRNATGGAINVVTNMPEVDGVKGFFDTEIGDYKHRRFKAMFNLPISDTVAIRAAGMKLERDGYIENLAYGQKNAAGETIQGIDDDVDGRDLWTGRITASWAFSDNGEAWIQYSKFSEDDDRARITNQVCVTNPLPLQGCVPGEVGFDGPNLGATTGTIFAAALGALPVGDPGNNLQGSQITYSYPRPELGLRSMHTDFEPIYQSEEELISLGVDYRFDNYSVSLLGAYQETQSDLYQDYNMDVGPDLLGAGPYLVSAPAGGAGGDWGDGPCNYNDGTAGIAGGCVYDMATDRSVSYDYSSGSSEYWTVEARIQSNLDGPFNFLVGASAYDSGSSGDYYVFANTLDLVGTVFGSYPSGFNSSRAGNNEGLETDGHAYFAEVYYDLNDRTKVTAGLRRNKDNKFIRDANAYLDAAFINPADPSKGYSREATFAQGGAVDDEEVVALYGATQAFADASTTGPLSAERLAAVALIPLVPQPGEVRKLTGSPQDFTWEETTGRIGIDYKLTDDNLLYAFYSVGYKPGGFNPPVSRVFQGDIKFDFDQEEITSIEIGSKNTLLDGTMKLNGSVFVYDYDGLQITRIANNSSINDNVDAEMWGAEIEFEWYPDMLPGVSIDGAYSFLDTEVANGAKSVDPTNRTAGNPAWTAVNDYSFDATAGVNYVVDTKLYTEKQAALVAAGAALPIPGTTYDNGLAVYLNRAGVQAADVGIDYDSGTLSNGIAQDLGGKSLPNSPEHTLKLGVAYAMPSPVLNGDLIVRLDYYWQDDMYAREFNTKGDLIEAWDQFNLSLIFESADGKWGARAWARNLADEDNVTGHYLTSDTSGFYRNYFLTEPRIFGASIRYSFGY